jgi:DNA-binding phage protein
MTLPNDDDESIPSLRTAVRAAVGGKNHTTTAGLAGVSKNTLWRAMNGKNIKVRTFLRVAEAGGYRVRFLLEKDNPTK